MQFVDEVDIHIQAGHGGSGSLSFRREKFVPRGGPDGGNGGIGGSVYAVADPHRNTLVHFQFNPEYKAQRGGNGAGALRTGRGGRDLEIPGAGRHADLLEGSRQRRARADRRPDQGRPARAARQGRPRRTGQRALRHLDQSRAAQGAARRRGRRVRSSPDAEAARGCRPGRLSECRQVDADLGDLGGEAEDRELPVHHADAEPRRRRAQRRSQLRGRRRARIDRRRARRTRPRPPVPAPHRAHQGADPPGRHLERIGTRSGRGLRHHPPRARSSTTAR